MIRFASLGSGSAGNALLVESGATCLMLDCGFGLRESVDRLQRLGRTPGDLTGILVTHEHGDHLGGVFRLARKFGLPVWLTHGTWCASGEDDAGMAVNIIDSHRPLHIGELEIQPFPVPHDAREPVQYVFSDGRLRLGVLTDLGEETPHVCAMLSGCDGLVLEFNHDPALLAASTYPPAVQRRIAGSRGHLSNAAAAALLARLDRSRLQHAVAAHLSERNNDPRLVAALLSGIFAGEAVSTAIAGPDAGFAWRQLA